mgnify:CR=1 FL=1
MELTVVGRWWPGTQKTNVGIILVLPRRPEQSVTIGCVRSYIPTLLRRVDYRLELLRLIRLDRLKCYDCEAWNQRDLRSKSLLILIECTSIYPTDMFFMIAR